MSLQKLIGSVRPVFDIAGEGRGGVEAPAQQQQRVQGQEWQMLQQQQQQQQIDPELERIKQEQQMAQSPQM